MKRFKLILLSTAFTILLCACGNNNIAETNTTDNTTSDTSSNTAQSSTASNLEAAVGEWVCVAENYNDTISIADDICLNSNISIYYEENKYKADLSLSYEGSSLEIYGKSLTEVNETLYEGCSNPSWYATLSEKDGTYFESFKLTMLDNDTLELFKTSIYYYEGEDPAENTYYTHYYFKKTDSDLEAAIYNYRYREEIVVSNVKDFYNALGNSKKIILKAGTYNFSELTAEDKNNDHVNWRYGYVYSDEYNDEPEWDYQYYDEQQAYCNDIQNLIIEGEEGAEVHICTENGFVAPLAFGNCNHITLKNLKIGHMIEPGYCTGSVVYLENTYNVGIQDCRLYGCGTYGIETLHSGNINVTASDIYECSYGLVSLRDSYSISFDNCTLRDSRPFSMFDINSCSSISFKNCAITGNDSSLYENQAFIDASTSYDDIIFDGCTFSGNIYNKLYDGEVTFTNCTMNDK